MYAWMAVCRWCLTCGTGTLRHPHDLEGQFGVESHSQRFSFSEYSIGWRQWPLRIKISFEKSSKRFVYLRSGLPSVDSVQISRGAICNKRSHWLSSVKCGDRQDNSKKIKLSFWLFRKLNRANCAKVNKIRERLARKWKSHTTDPHLEQNSSHC